jgi:hypothetical protein
LSRWPSKTLILFSELDYMDGIVNFFCLPYRIEKVRAKLSVDFPVRINSHDVSPLGYEDWHRSIQPSLTASQLHTSLSALPSQVRAGLLLRPFHGGKDPFVQRFVEDAVTGADIKHKFLMSRNLSLREFKQSLA